MDGYVGEIRMFGGTYAPLGWAFCNGQMLNIMQYTPLYTVIGAVYGGNAQTTFALPNLCGRTAVGVNTSNAALPTNALGMKSGAETRTLTLTQMPAHVHAVAGTLTLGAKPGAVDGTGTGTSPVNTYPGVLPNTYGANADTIMGPSQFNVSISSATAQAAGGSQPHENRQPFIGMNYIICIDGNYPPRP